MAVVDDIRQLKELLDMGAITQEEFDRMKAELLSAPIEASTSQPRAAASTTSDKSKIAAGLLAIFLGTLGIHKFYLGYQREGLIMLLVSLLTLGIGACVMAVIALIEGILYLTRSDADFEALYVQGHKGWF